IYFLKFYNYKRMFRKFSIPEYLLNKNNLIYLSNTLGVIALKLKTKDLIYLSIYKTLIFLRPPTKNTHFWLLCLNEKNKTFAVFASRLEKNSGIQWCKPKCAPRAPST